MAFLSTPHTGARKIRRVEISQFASFRDKRAPITDDVRHFLSSLEIHISRKTLIYGESPPMVPRVRYIAAIVWEGAMRPHQPYRRHPAIHVNTSSLTKVVSRSINSSQTEYGLGNGYALIRLQIEDMYKNEHQTLPP